MLFADVVGSTAHAARLGDRRWHDLLSAFYSAVRAELSRFRGRELDTAGDSLFATFEGPARAIRRACAISDAVRQLDAGRVGLHTGECEVIGSKVGGLAVHIGARVAALAGPGEVLVSSTVRDLVAGSGLLSSHQSGGPASNFACCDHLYLYATLSYPDMRADTPTR